MPRILIADVPESVLVLSDLLSTQGAIVPAHDLDEALNGIRRGVDLIVTGIHFADSQMLDLVQRVKTDPRTRALPVICVRVIAAERAPALLTRLQPVLDALGDVEYVDLHGLMQSIGREQALREFSIRVRHRLATGRRAQQD